MPDPKTAKAEHEAREKLRKERLRVAREKRRQQPAEIQKRKESEERQRRWSDAHGEAWRARREEDVAGPLYEALADAFDFADPELWKSNSFAALRPRLVLHVRARHREARIRTRVRNRPQSQAVYVGCDEGGTPGGSSPQRGRDVCGDRQERAGVAVVLSGAIADRAVLRDALARRGERAAIFS